MQQIIGLYAENNDIVNRPIKIQYLGEKIHVI